MRLAPVRRSVFAAFLLFCSVLGWTQSVSTRVFRVPYRALNGMQESNVFLSVPFVPIGESWSVFSARKARSENEAALQELLGALYRGDAAAAQARINPPKDAASGKAFADYVAAFRGSLSAAGEFYVEGYFPLKGRVRFALRPAAGNMPYRLFTFRTGGDGRLRFDETVAPNKVDSALNSVFNALKDMKLEVKDLPTDGYTVVTAGPNIRVSVKARPVNARLDKIGGSAADPWLQFYRSCLDVPDKQSLDHYFSCFPADVQSRLREQFGKMTAENQDQLFAMTTTPRHVDFVVENPSSVIVYYHSTRYAVASRDWIQRTSGGEYVLLNPLAFFPLDDLISSPEIRGAIAASLGIGPQGGGGTRGK